MTFVQSQCSPSLPTQDLSRVSESLSLSLSLSPSLSLSLSLSYTLSLSSPPPLHCSSRKRQSGPSVEGRVDFVLGFFVTGNTAPSMRVGVADYRESTARRPGVVLWA